MKKPTAMDYWKLSNVLSVKDAAILITGNDPSEEEFSDVHQNEKIQRTSYEGFDATFKALKNAVLDNELAATLVFHETGEYRRSIRVTGPNTVKLLRGAPGTVGPHAHILVSVEPDWERTGIRRADLIKWLKSRNFPLGFFAPDIDPDSIENKENPKYSPKLACAVAAWGAIKRAAANKSTKQTIHDWVKANGNNFGLSNDEGVVSESVAKDIAAIVNWDPKGGATPTFSEVANDTDQQTETEPQNYRELRDYEGDPFEEDIPF